MTDERKTSPPVAARWKALTLAAAALALAAWASPQAALVAGIAAALLPGRPPGPWAAKTAQWLMQASVVALGFSLDLPTILRLGLHGSLLAAATIAAAQWLGQVLGRRLGLGRNTRLLISAGTAICGGSAIAAVSAVIAATEAEIAVSIGAVFLLNAAALYLFPLMGHHLGLKQAQFGLWAGVAIHDISSVVGAGMSYGPQALATATAVKLARTLWIVPLTLGLAWRQRRTAQAEGGPTKLALPWFIALFLAAAWARGAMPAVAALAPWLAKAAGRGMVLVLFLVGNSLNYTKLKAVGWRALALGVALWALISAGSLLAVVFLG